MSHRRALVRGVQGDDGTNALDPGRKLEGDARRGQQSSVETARGVADQVNGPSALAQRSSIVSITTRALRRIDPVGGAETTKSSQGSPVVRMRSPNALVIQRVARHRAKLPPGFDNAFG